MGDTPSKACVVVLALLVGINLRPIMASIGPLLDVLQADLGLSNLQGGLLTTLPVMMMGLFALRRPVAATPGRRGQGRGHGHDPDRGGLRGAHLCRVVRRADRQRRCGRDWHRRDPVADAGLHQAQSSAQRRYAHGPVHHGHHGRGGAGRSPGRTQRRHAGLEPDPGLCRVAGDDSLDRLAAGGRPCTRPGVGRCTALAQRPCLVAVGVLRDRNRGLHAGAGLAATVLRRAGLAGEKRRLSAGRADDHRGHRRAVGVGADSPLSGSPPAFGTGDPAADRA